jgi:hypothetical protein
LAGAVLAIGLGGCANDHAAKSDPAAMMAKMTELGTPGLRHRLINAFVGTWNAEVKYWMDADQKEPEVSRGTMTVRAMFEGRYVHGEYRGSFSMPGQDGKMMEVPFEGRALWAYSNADEEFQSLWIDSFSTSVMMSSGKGSADGKSIMSTGHGKGPDTSGKVVDQKMWSTMTMLSDNHWREEMWSQCPGGPKFKNMEINYTRTGK